MEKIAAVKHMRDFYPEEMRQRLRIEDAWRTASLRAGFQEWDSPIMEYLDLYKRKSGEEIVGQLYTLHDRGERDLAVRPEMTPSLARMVAARQGALPRPVKWFCIARMCRCERGQKGRLREFWQWNADVLGSDSPSADAEIVAVALDGLRLLGLGVGAVEVRWNSRTLMAALLGGLGLPPETHAGIYAVADKAAKLPPNVLAEQFAALGLSAEGLERVRGLLACGSLEAVEAFAAANGCTGHEPALAHLRQTVAALDDLGFAGQSRFDIGIVRGLAYYTGPVFEIFDIKGEHRALAGGGRYDNLLAAMGGQAMPAAGFGMGDVVLANVLEEAGLLADQGPQLDCFVIPLAAEREADARRLAGQLRRMGQRVDFAAAGNLGKLFKRADALGAATVALVGGAEWERGMVKYRDMKTGAEREEPAATSPSPPA